MNLFYTSLDNRISKFKVYNVHTMADEFMVVSGMPNRIGELIYLLVFVQISRIINCGIPQSGKTIGFVWIFIGLLLLNPTFKHSLL